MFDQLLVEVKRLVRGGRAITDVLVNAVIEEQCMKNRVCEQELAHLVENNAVKIFTIQQERVDEGKICSSSDL